TRRRVTLPLYQKLFAHSSFVQLSAMVDSFLRMCSIFTRHRRSGEWCPRLGLPRQCVIERANACVAGRTDPVEGFSPLEIARPIGAAAGQSPRTSPRPIGLAFLYPKSAWGRNGVAEGERARPRRGDALDRPRAWLGYDSVEAGVVQGEANTLTLIVG